MKNGIRRLAVPDIPKDEWCDFRKDYESGLSLVQIGEKYYCDPRTAKMAIIHNKSSNNLGKRVRPSILSGYEKKIPELWQKNLEMQSLFSVSKNITENLREEGFTGSERTVRNYLKRQPYVMAYLEGKGHD